MYAIVIYPQRENGCDPAVQTNGDTWHFPSSDGNRWLCVQKAKT